MFIYNVTVSITKEAEDEWIQWMKEVHIPNVMQSGMFTSHRLFKVLSHDDPSTSSFCTMYSLEVLDNFVRYLNEFAPAMRKEIDDKFGGRYAAFRTLLEEL
jgi:hypothetical protein